MTNEELLELKTNPNANGEPTIREYLHLLLLAIWQEGEGFSGKRPFGDSGWEYDLYVPLIRHGIVDGTLDEEPDTPEDLDEDDSDEWDEDDDEPYEMPEPGLMEAAYKLEDELKEKEVLESYNLDYDGDGVVSEEELKADINKDGVLSEEEQRALYENTWKRAYNGAPYYSHPWFDWKKSERWINDRDAINYWLRFRGGNQSALNEYQTKYPTDFNKKTY